MVESKGYWNGFVNGVPGDDSFHHLINILDFPMESFECDNNTDEVEDWEAQFQRLGPIPSEILQGLTPVLEVNTGNGIPGVRPNNLGVNDANSELNKLVDVEVSSDSSHAKFRTRSPSSVLESTGSCSAKTSKSTISELLVPVRTRTKRPRPAVCKWHLIPPITSSKKTLNRKVTEKKKRKMPGPVDSGTTENSSDQHTVSKRCTHCQVSKTPQWREGPMGPKTLCNACGVRYRSGRLFPEYRPAASPTFVPSLHSNSHKKVIQMRSKSIQESPMPEKGPSMSTPPEFPPMESIHMKNESIDEYLMTEMGPAMSPPPEFVPMSSYLFDRM